MLHGQHAYVQAPLVPQAALYLCLLDSPSPSSCSDIVCYPAEASAAVKRLQAFLLCPETEETKRSPITEADMVGGMVL